MQRILMLRVGMFRRYYVGTILLPFSRESIMVPGPATILGRDSGVWDALNLNYKYVISHSYVSRPLRSVSR